MTWIRTCVATVVLASLIALGCVFVEDVSVVPASLAGILLDSPPTEAHDEGTSTTVAASLRAGDLGFGFRGNHSLPRPQVSDVTTSDASEFDVNLAASDEFAYTGFEWPPFGAAYYPTSLLSSALAAAGQEAGTAKLGDGLTPSFAGALASGGSLSVPACFDIGCSAIWLLSSDGDLEAIGNEILESPDAGPPGNYYESETPFGAPSGGGASDGEPSTNGEPPTNGVIPPIGDSPTTSVPEPATLALFGPGLAFLSMQWLRRRSA